MPKLEEAIAVPPEPEMTSKVNTRFFVNRIADLDLSNRETARRLNMHFASFHRIIHGQRKVQLDELVALAELLRLPLAEVIENFGVRIRKDAPQAEIVAQVEKGVLMPYVGETRRIESPVEDAVAVLDTATGWLYFATPIVPNRIDPLAVGRLALVEMRPAGSVVAVRELGTLALDRLNGRYSVIRLDGAEVKGAVAAASPVVWVRP